MVPMQSTLVFLPYKDFKDETLSTIRLFFDRWKVPYSITSYKALCTGYHGATCKADILTGKASVQDFGSLMLLDGKGIDSLLLYEYRPLLDMVILFSKASKPIFAIGNAIKIAARANIVKGKQVSLPSDENAKVLVQQFMATLSAKPLEKSDNLYTIGNSDMLSEVIDGILDALDAK